MSLCENEIYSNSIIINIINNTTENSYYMIRDIQAVGYDVLNQLEDIEPQYIPINSIPELYIVSKLLSFKYSLLK